MASKKINELLQSVSSADTDLFIVETASGTRAISYEKLLKPVNDEIGKTNQKVADVNNEIGKTNQKVAAISPSANAAAHNGIFRGKNLTNVYTIDQICARIANGTFEDLYIGDYFDITISTSYTASEVVRCVIAGFDMYWNNGDTAFTEHHAVIVTKNCFTATAAMNATNTTEGGFMGSAMWKNVLSTYATAISAKLGSHFLAHRVLLTNKISTTGVSMAGAGLTGYASSWAWASTTIVLLSEIQVYGANVWSSSGYDTGIDNLQLPLFRLDPTAKVCGKGGTTSGGRQWYWLRNVASAAHFAGVNYLGDSYYYGASNSGGVRPLFCIG